MREQSECLCVPAIVWLEWGVEMVRDLLCLESLQRALEHYVLLLDCTSIRCINTLALLFCVSVVESQVIS